MKILIRNGVEKPPQNCSLAEILKFQIGDFVRFPHFVNNNNRFYMTIYRN
jgi:hypothetical protein